MYNDSSYFFNEEKFLLENGTFSYYEPSGVKWNDSFCRRIVNEGQPGCFVERDIDLNQIDRFIDPNRTGRSLTTSLNNDMDHHYWPFKAVF